MLQYNHEKVKTGLDELFPQVYLRHWAKDLNIPILSVDYSLAPEFPFPRQLEEIFFAYCWAIRNHTALGKWF